MTKPDVMDALTQMILEVLGDQAPLDPITAETSFRDGLGFDSIQYIALADLIQDRYDDVSFVAWIQAKELPQILALCVGDVADFVVASTPA